MNCNKRTASAVFFGYKMQNMCKIKREGKQEIENV